MTRNRVVVFAFGPSKESQEALISETMLFNLLGGANERHVMKRPRFSSQEIVPATMIRNRRTRREQNRLDSLQRGFIRSPKRRGGASSSRLIRAENPVSPLTMTTSTPVCHVEKKCHGVSLVRPSA